MLGGAAETLIAGHNIEKAGILNRSLTVILFSIAVCLGFASIFVRDIGASYHVVSQWDSIRYFFETSFGGIGTLLDLCQQVVLLCLLFMLLLDRKPRNPLFILAAFSSCVIYGLIATVGEHIQLFDALFGGVPLVICIVPLMIIGGEDRELLCFIRKYSLPAASLALLFGILSAFRFQMIGGWGATIGWCPARDYLAIGMSFLWVSAGLNMCSGFYSRQIAACALACLLSLLLATRSWLIQPLLLMLVLTVSSPIKFRFKRTIVLSLVCVVAVLAVSIVMPDVVDGLIGRIGEDTRTGQYDIFFNQVDPKSLVFGNGMSAGYQYGDELIYRWFDNQLLYLAFHFGLLPVLVLVYVLVKTIFGNASLRAKSVCLFYTLALLGLSNYYSFALNCGVVAVFISFGGYEYFSRSTMASSVSAIESVNSD